MQDIDVKRRRTTALLLSLTLPGLLAAPQARAGVPAGVDAAIVRAAAAFMADPRAVGLSVGVIQPGRQHSRHFGTVSKSRPHVADDRSIYPIASLTKTFAGALLAQAQLDGKLKLDDDIREHLHGSYPNLEFEGQPIRIYHLLNHRSGLPRLLPDRPEAAPDFPSGVPYAQRLSALVAGTTRPGFYEGLHQVRLTAAPGARFQYSNAGAQLAGHILERLYGGSFETLVRQRIAAPLGMRDTCITLTAQQKQRLADGYDETGTPQAPFPDQMQAAGALKSTLADMLAYARWQLAERDPAVRLSHQPTWRDGEDAVGLNWQMLTRGTRRVIFQDGSHPGYACLLVLHPESGIAIVLLSNEIDRNTAQRLATLANDIGKSLDADILALT
jgi:CubicO group peptidase (beta-lactamase class C family)